MDGGCSSDRVCPYCDAEIAEASFPYCEACQVSLVACPKCGKKVSREVLACPHCGARMNKGKAEGK